MISTRRGCASITPPLRFHCTALRLLCAAIAFPSRCDLDVPRLGSRCAAIPTRCFHRAALRLPCAAIALSSRCDPDAPRPGSRSATIPTRCSCASVALRYDFCAPQLRSHRDAISTFRDPDPDALPSRRAAVARFHCAPINAAIPGCRARAAVFSCCNPAAISSRLISFPAPHLGSSGTALRITVSPAMNREVSYSANGRTSQHTLTTQRYSLVLYQCPVLSRRPAPTFASSSAAGRPTAVTILLPMFVTLH